MDIITLDFETYYDNSEFTLKKLTTEAYVRDPRFQVIGVGVKINDEPTVWASGTHRQVRGFLDSFLWDNAMLLCHNTRFDGFILSEHFGIHARRYLDTMSMAKALHGFDAPASLAALATRYGVGAKGTEVALATGKRREDFTPEELAAYGEYCVNDVELTREIFQRMIESGFPKQELQLIDLTIKMFTRPRLALDTEALAYHLDAVRRAKSDLLLQSGMQKADLMSNPKMAALLESFGVIPPTKISPTTGRETYAFAKSDEDFKALLEHSDERVQTIVAARLGVKSTLEETRTQRFFDIGKRGLMPVPLKYYAAHTGRWGGDDSVNLQNLPSRGPNAKKIKKAILAPEGHYFIDSDSSQIEARVLAWLAEQEDLVTAFKQGQDVYKIMASAIYNQPVEGISEAERQIGKLTILGCVAEKTPVLCDSGWKPIEQVTTEDKLWDGEEWVCHQGLLKKGIKPTQSVYGAWLTADHPILCGTQWLETQSVVLDDSTLSRALATGAANLPLPATSKIYGVGSVQSLYPVSAGAPSTLWTCIISDCSSQHGAESVQEPPEKLPEKSIGGTLTSSLTSTTDNDCLTALPRVSDDAIQKRTPSTISTGGAASVSTNHGALTEERSYGTCWPSITGTTPLGRLTESTTTEGTNQATSDLQPEKKTCGTDAPSQPYKKKLMTYDLAYAGPRNRFTILTERGPIIVHNCGYGMGASKFRAQLKTYGVPLTEDEAAHIIRTYRETYPCVVRLWRNAQNVIEQMVQGVSIPFGRPGVIGVEADSCSLRFPSQLLLTYRNLKATQNEQGKTEYVYTGRYGAGRIYGGKVVENVCQGIARCIIGEQMLRIAKRYDVVMTVHDSVGVVVPDAQLEPALDYIEECMRWVPAWAEGLPVNCEAKYGRSYAVDQARK